MTDITQQAADTALTAIRVSGNDRMEFLQGQFTQDLGRLTQQKPLLAGWNSPKGRLYCVSWLADWQDAVWLAVPAPLAGAIAKRLGMYVLRADASIEISEMPVHPKSDNIGNKDSVNSCIYNKDHLMINAPGGGWQLGGEAPTAGWDEWRLNNIRAGFPVIWPANSEAFVPQMVNLDLLSGISFEKGCYVGQEIVARTQNLGRIKRRMFRLTCDDAAISPGDALTADGVNAGTVVDAINGEVLAVIRLEKLAAELSVAGAALQLADLPYAIPEAAG